MLGGRYPNLIACVYNDNKSNSGDLKDAYFRFMQTGHFWLIQYLVWERGMIMALAHV